MSKVVIKFLHGSAVTHIVLIVHLLAANILFGKNCGNWLTVERVMVIIKEVPFLEQSA